MPYATVELEATSTSSPPCRKYIKLDNTQLDKNQDVTMQIPIQNTEHSTVESLPLSTVKHSPLLSASMGIQIRKLKGDLELVTKDLKEQQKVNIVQQLITDKTQDFDVQMQNTV